VMGQLLSKMEECSRHVRQPQEMLDLRVLTDGRCGRPEMTMCRHVGCQLQGLGEIRRHGARGAPDLDPDPDPSGYPVFFSGSGRIWIRPDTKILGSGKMWIRPDPKSLDPVNRIHYHVVPITVSMHCVLSPNGKMTQICLVYCLL